ncbi:ABC transporter ATP-binding protein [Candidatus Solincola tengchongensis]|uniref:ABC transporter ATP-binding protein n=1 Tax=Candidatus Solincola tengchongensis TaxID=2900693 RepID=UPI00257C1E54|nr:ABC transporter ATP-binding protein [Candidatus Solincola tengchongensis]
MSVLLSLRGIGKDYQGRRVLHVEYFGIEQGMITAVVGPNGSGKSTLLRIVNLLERPSRGEIVFWDGSRLSALGRRERMRLARQMAMLFQDPILFRRSVEDNLAYGLKVRRMPRGERKERVREMLRRLDLEHLASREASTLSGGEAQKVALGRALVLKPRLLLMDEPLSNLDLPSRREMLRLIPELVREAGVTALYVSHDYHEVLEIADRLAVLIDGVLHQVGRPGEVFARPVSEEVASFLGAENLLEGEVVRRDGEMVGIKVGEGELVALGDHRVGSRVKVLVHPEEVVLHAPGGEAGSARNRLDARVLEVREMGALVKVRLDCGFPLTAHVTRASREEMGIAPGRVFTVALKATSLHVMPFSGEPR